MNRQARAFYRRYDLLANALQLLAPWLLGYLLVFAIVLLPQATHALRLTLWLLWGIVCLFGYRLGWLGWLAVGLPKRLVQLSEVDQQRYELAWQAAGKAVGPMKLMAVELGEVPLLQAGGFSDDQLWISTHTLRNLEPVQLACLLAHEYAHVRDRGYDRQFALWQLLWLLSINAYWLFRIDYLLAIAVALLHALVFTRLYTGWWRSVELRADRYAADACGPESCAQALAAYLRLFACNRQDKALHARLRALGYKLAAADRLDSVETAVVRLDDRDA